MILSFLAVSFGLFTGLRMLAGPAPESMSQEWQELSNEKLKVRSAKLVSIQTSGSRNWVTVDSF